MGAITKSIDEYSNAKDQIKIAMEAAANSDESKQAIRSAMQLVLPNAQKCQNWMDFAKRASDLLTKQLLPRLATPIIANEENGNANDNNNEQKNNNDDENKNLSE